MTSPERDKNKNIPGLQRAPKAAVRVVPGEYIPELPKFKGPNFEIVFVLNDGRSYVTSKG